MKNSFLIFLTLIALTSCGQSKKKLPTKEVTVTDGGKYEYILYPKQDSLRWYNPGQDTFKMTVTFNRLQNGHPMPDIITQIDDNFFGEEYAIHLHYQPQSYSGDNILNPLGWNFSKDQLFNVTHHNNTLAFLQTDGWVDYSFNGYKIEYYAEKFESYGIAGVSVDNAPETMVDLYYPTEMNNSTMVFVADSLKNDTTHTIRVRYTKQRNPNSNRMDARITLDKFVTYQKQPNLFLPPTSSDTTKSKQSSSARMPTQQYDPKEKPKN
jgi:hypothetical protein